MSTKKTSSRGRRPASAGARSTKSPAKPTFTYGFMDETGTLGGERDPFFAVGLLRCSDPHLIHRPIQRIRDKHAFYEEIKWNKVSAKKLPLLNQLVDMVLGSEVTFSAFIADKNRHDIIGRFGGPFPAYEALARQIVCGSVKRGETMWVVADEYSTPAHELFEENVRDYVNNRLGRPAVASVCRMRSSGVDLMQMIDIFLGAIVYEYKASRGVVGLGSYKPKVQLLEHIKAQAGIETFLGGIKTDRWNIAEYKG